MRQLEIVTRVIKTGWHGRFRINEFRHKYGSEQVSETSQVYSSTQGRVGMFTHPACLLGAHDLFCLLLCKQFSAATRAYARQILLVRSSGSMWSRWRW